MLGYLYDRALAGERCWVRHDDGRIRTLPVQAWLGGHAADHEFDRSLLALCQRPTIELGCGPGRLVAELIRRGIPALGVDRSATAVALAQRNGAPALHCDVFEPLPGSGRWGTVLLADGNVGLGGDPCRILRRAAELLDVDGTCLAEVDPCTTGVRMCWVRLESSHGIGPWFRWASVGVDGVERLAEHVGMSLSEVHRIGDRAVAALTAAALNTAHPENACGARHVGGSLLFE